MDDFLIGRNIVKTNTLDMHGLTPDFLAVVVTMVTFTFMKNCRFLLCKVLSTITKIKVLLLIIFEEFIKRFTEKGVTINIQCFLRCFIKAKNVTSIARKIGLCGLLVYSLLVYSLNREVH